MAEPATLDPPAVPAAVQARPRRYAKLPDFLDALGGIPLDRIVFDPWPGTATVQDCLEYGERIAPAELIDNTIVEKGMSFWECRIAFKLGRRIDDFAEEHDFGIVNGADAQMRVKGGNVRLPDVTFTAKNRIPGDVAVPDLSPDLIVEVLSPSNTKKEIDRKLGEFFPGGTRLAWVVDRRTRTVAVHRGQVGPAVVIGEGDALDGEDVLPGFSIKVVDLFAGVPSGE